MPHQITKAARAAAIGIIAIKLSGKGMDKAHAKAASNASIASSKPAISALLLL